MPIYSQTVTVYYRRHPLCGRRLLSAEHFTIDGTLLEAWAGQKSLLESDASVDDRSRRPIVQQAKGHDAKLAYLGEVLMENRSGLVVDACVVPATGTGERDAATGLIAAPPRRRVDR